MLTFEQIKELATLVADKKLEAIELERTGFKLQIRGRDAIVEASRGVAAALASGAESRSPATEALSIQAADPQETAGVEPQGHVLSSPIVGTFYRSPSPDSDPYTDVGQRVRKGQVLCIIEAMKLMNEIESDVDGEVAKILPQNAQAVEFGEPLFVIRPN